MGAIDIAFTKPMIKIPDIIDLKTLEYEAEPNVWKPVINIDIIPSVW